jgi:hypothetical protein
MKYYISFESWIIELDETDQDKAYTLVMEEIARRKKDGVFPTVTEIENEYNDSLL